MRKESFLYGRLNSVAIENKSNNSVFVYGIDTIDIKIFSKQELSTRQNKMRNHFSHSKINFKQHFGD